jgi:ParB family chromosome partitioning protein
MTVKPLDLSALDAFDDAGATRGAGVPLMLDIDRVHEDPDNPRKAFDGLIEMAESIAEVGVKVPITVRPHPTIPGDYMIKFGARRRRASISAGLKQIPAWIDNVPSDFEQVIENLQREDLTAMELAQFMADKVAAGLKPTEIAKRLGIVPPTVIKHLALIDMPPEIDAAYQKGRTTSPETIYELRALYKHHPDETKAWLAKDVEASRRSVEELKRSLEGGQGIAVSVAAPAAKRGRPPKVEDPGEIKRPVVVVRVGERYGLIVLNRRANEDDHTLVKWDDTAEVEQVANHNIVFLRLDDARRYEPIGRGLTSLAQDTPFPPAKPIAHA